MWAILSNHVGMDTETKVGKFTVKSIGPETDRVLEFTGTTETEDRDGDIIKADGWQFDRYLKNPVFLPFHNAWTVPAAKCVGISKAPGSTGTSFQIKFATIDELCSNPSTPSNEALLADTLYNAYKNGYMNAVSIGFIPLESQENDSNIDIPAWQRGRIFTRQEMLELSAVAIPSNPDALIQARGFKGWKDGKQLKMLQAIFEAAEQKGVIPFKKYPLAEEDATWDGPAIVKASDTEDLKKICTWYDSSKDDADLTKGDFKLPHHESSADGYKTNWKGISAAMGALLGARGGVNIPDDDHEGCYNHLKKHYAEFGKDAPDFKAYTAAELKAMFPEETDMDEKAVQKAISDAVEPLLKQIDILKQATKSGAKYSADTLAKMQEIHDYMDKALTGMKGMISDSGTVATRPGSNDGVEVPEPNIPDNDENDKEIDFTKIDLKRYEVGA